VKYNSTYPREICILLGDVVTGAAPNYSAAAAAASSAAAAAAAAAALPSA